MAAVLAEVAMVTARALLNDVSGQDFTDVVLQPFVVQAFRELQSKLYAGAASIVRKVISPISVPANTFILPNSTITDLVEPIRLWERSNSSSLNADWTLMTEYDPLPSLDPDAIALHYWQWDGTNINLVGCTVPRKVKINYWVDLVEPSTPTSSLVFIDAEIYIAPRAAALAAASLGQDTTYARLDPVAQGAIQLVLDANRGRKRQIVPVPGV